MPRQPVTDVHAELLVHRSSAEAMRLFDGPITGWLPVIVGHDEGTWRAQTQEGPVRLHVQVHAGGPWVLPDGTHRRALSVQADRTNERDMVLAALTPRVEGHLDLAPTGDDEARLEFDGRTRGRSRLTGAVERLVLGGPLVRSGMATLLELIAERLATGPVDTPSDGPLQGPVRVPLPRR